MSGLISTSTSIKPLAVIRNAVKVYVIKQVLFSEVLLTICHDRDLYMNFMTRCESISDIFIYKFPRTVETVPYKLQVDLTDIVFHKSKFLIKTAQRHTNLRFNYIVIQNK